MVQGKLGASGAAPVNLTLGQSFFLTNLPATTIANLTPANESSTGA